MDGIELIPDNIRNKPIKFMCCFCGKGVDSKKMCWITVSIDVDQKKYIDQQTYWCHKKCFKNSLDKICQEEMVLGDKK